MKEIECRSELGKIRIHRPVNKMSTVIIGVILLGSIFFKNEGLDLFDTVLYIMFCIFIIVSVGTVIKIIKIIVRNFWKEKSSMQYEPKRLEWIYNVFEKIFLIFLPLGLLVVREEPIILTLPIIIFLILVYVAIKNHRETKKNNKNIEG